MPDVKTAAVVFLNHQSRTVGHTPLLTERTMAHA